jgi:hypothetical protein
MLPSHALTFCTTSTPVGCAAATGYALPQAGCRVCLPPPPTMWFQLRPHNPARGWLQRAVPDTQAQHSNSGAGSLPRGCLQRCTSHHCTQLHNVCTSAQVRACPVLPLCVCPVPTSQGLTCVPQAGAHWAAHAWLCEAEPVAFCPPHELPCTVDLHRGYDDTPISRSTNTETHTIRLSNESSCPQCSAAQQHLAG